MKYLNPTFTVGPPSRVTACKRCIYSTGEHADHCGVGRVQRQFREGVDAARGVRWNQIPEALSPTDGGKAVRRYRDRWPFPEGFN